MTSSRSKADPNKRWSLDILIPAMVGEIWLVRRALDDLELPSGIADDAKLLATELVTNSVRHGGMTVDEQVHVSATWSGELLRVDVFDSGEGHDPRRVAGGIRPGPGAEAGWGLYLIDRLASRWGNSRGHYWFEMAAATAGV
jgi:LytS/YehU family sensor histidine kinase